MTGTWGLLALSSLKVPTTLMMPSSCRIAPSEISSQDFRSIARVIIARLRTIDMAMTASPLKRGPWARLGCGDEGFLLGESALDLILEVCSQLHAKLFAFGRKQIARPSHIDRNNRLNAAGPGGEDDDPVRQRNRLVDMVCYKEHRGPAA